ncbi:MAG: AAA family ATPase [Actinobacteria bacterium]|nr:AAA family ATPase [Actinomycetota bacterium]
MDADKPTLIITRGLPGCGKTTAAREWVDAQPRGMWLRLNRDDLRRMGLPSDYSKPEVLPEKAINAARDGALTYLLRRGWSVICDDTNLPTRYVRELMKIAQREDAEVEIWDMTHVPLETCIQRDAARCVGHVGETVIRGMYDRYLATMKGKPLPVPVLTDADAVVEPYVAPTGALQAFLVDLDGTLALFNGRNPYDESRVIDDLPNRPVIVTVRALMSQGLHPIFMSGRTDGCREDTEAWLGMHVLGYGTPWELHMRAVGDTRPDWQVKLDLFNTHIRDRYGVFLAVDDRQQVVDLWRSLGITCLQCAEGNF